ncbi:MAG: transposase, partial [Eubacteriales bacterium]
MSAFVQQRDKISPTAFEDLFRQFVANTDATVTHHGYRLLAVDGSSLHVPTNPKEVDSYHQKANDSKPFNLLHLNAMYDILRKTYVDATVEKGENKAFSTMVARNQSTVPTIYIADRGYESYNNFAH